MQLKPYLQSHNLPSFHVNNVTPEVIFQLNVSGCVSASQLKDMSFQKISASFPLLFAGNPTTVLQLQSHVALGFPQTSLKTVDEAVVIRMLLSIQFCLVQPLSHVQLSAIPWTAACQASLSITNSWSLLKLMFIELVMPSNAAQHNN